MPAQHDYAEMRIAGAQAAVRAALINLYVALLDDGVPVGTLSVAVDWDDGGFLGHMGVIVGETTILEATL